MRRSNAIFSESGWRIVALPKCLSPTIGEENVQIGDVPTKMYFASKTKRRFKAVPTQMSFVCPKVFPIFNRGTI